MQALFTTEGHLLLLRAGGLSAFPSYQPGGHRHTTKRKRWHRTANITQPLNHSHALTQDTCHLPVDGWHDMFKPYEPPVRPRAPRMMSEQDLMCPLEDQDASAHDVHMSVLPSIEALLQPAMDSFWSRHAPPAMPSSMPSTQIPPMTEVAATLHLHNVSFTIGKWSYVRSGVVFFVRVLAQLV